MLHKLAKNTLQAVLVAAGCAAAAPAFAGAWQDWKDVKEPDAYRIVQYLGVNDGTAESRMVVVDAGAQDGLLKGTILKVYRSSPTPKGEAGQGIWVETGRLKVTDVQDEHAVAEVVESGSAQAKAFFPKFPGVMAGDLAVAPRLTIAANQAVTPSTTLYFQKLFIDPKATPETFELSGAGMDSLREAAKAFENARLSLLMVEGYTDANGPSDANQIESYQRALTVRQYLVDELGFDAERVVAVGLGEGEQVDISNAPGYVDANRRLVLKAVPIPGSAAMP
jgi:outer membrane protein OmpA-like peptidoglycan-associated protein